MEDGKSGAGTAWKREEKDRPHRVRPPRSRAPGRKKEEDSSVRLVRCSPLEGRKPSGYSRIKYKTME
ncbi:unnamed protein product [Arctogadus glacialis]